MITDNIVSIQNEITGYLDRALGFFMVKDYDEAIRNYKAAEVLDKYNPEILYNLGISYVRLGLHKTALAYFYRVLALNSGFIGTLSVKKLIAFTLIHTDQYSEAIQYVREVIQDSPSDIMALNMAAYCHEMEKNYFDALKIYGHILSIDSNNINACNGKAFILALTGGDLKTALKLALKAYNAVPDNPAYCDTIGFICFKAGKFTKAEEYLVKALKLLPLSKDIREHLNELSKLNKQKKISV